jgi:hypothetical protein
MGRPTLAAPTTQARRARHPEPRRAARRLAITSMVLAAAVYLLGWAGPEPEIFRVLNVLGLVTALCALGPESTSFLVGAAVASNDRPTTCLAGARRFRGRMSWSAMVEDLQAKGWTTPPRSSR